MNDRLFYEYAIIPDIFRGDYIKNDKRLEIILVELLKGICMNGMIANLNKDGWFKFIMNDRLSTIVPQSLNDKLKCYFNTLHDRNRLVRHPKSKLGEPSTDIEWLKLALESHQRIKFDGIISGEPMIANTDMKCDEFIDALTVLDSMHWQERRRTLTLTACEPYYRPVLDPILRHAKSLIIVDPYFSPHDQKYINFLKICVEQMGFRGSSTSILNGRINIHTGDPTADMYHSEPMQDRVNAWEICIKNLFTTAIPHKIKIFFRKKRNKINSPKFHDRFILTDQCCISIPMGTDTFGNSTPNRTTWALLDYEDMQKKAAEIDPAMNIYETIGERLIT